LTSLLESATRRLTDSNAPKRLDESSVDPFAKTIAISSAAGSPGRSVLANNLATEFAMFGESVLLIDLDLEAPGQAQLLGLTSTPVGLSAAMRLARQARLDQAALNRLCVKLAVGRFDLNFLPGLASRDRANEVSLQDLNVLINLAETHFDNVVVDLPALVANPMTHTERLTTEVLQRAGGVVLMTAADPLSAARFIELRASCSWLAGTNRTVVVNRFRTTALGSNAKADIAHALARFADSTIDAFVPEDAAGFDAAMLNGLPLSVLKRASPARLAIQALARGLVSKRHEDARHENAMRL
jgi:MinD-like ATPase involved in chromosome partitioning or flagellar assembly